MGADIIPYDPYHPHLGYTLLITCLAWIGVAVYSRSFLRRSTHTRTFLYALAIILPIYAEAAAFLINRLRPAPNTLVGYVLTHIHAHVIQRIPIDSFLSPTAGEIALILFTGLILGSLARFMIGTYQLNHALASAAPPSGAWDEGRRTKDEDSLLIADRSSFVIGLSSALRRHSASRARIQVMLP